MKTEQPLWGRGVMVSPQHFQQQAAYAAWSAECIAQMGLNHPWGVIHAEFEADVLKLGRVQARHLHVRFQDGTLIDTNNGDDLPPVIMPEGHDVVVMLALPLLRANGGNCLQPDDVAERPVRYRQRWRDIRNQFGDDNLTMPMEENAAFVAVVGLFRQPDLAKDNWRQVLEREALDQNKPRLLEAGDNSLILQPLKDK